MTTARDPRNIATTFGGFVLGDGGFVTIYKTKVEADIRRSLASVAHAYGWDVSEEVVIPGWGRIDLVLEADGHYLIELKVDLTKPARIRRAFQQADGYGRWWTANKGKPADVLLVGAEMDEDAIASVADAYYAVWPRTIGAILNFLECGGTEAARAIRHARAKARAERAAELAGIYARSLDRLTGHLPEPKPSQEAQQLLAGGTA